MNERIKLLAEQAHSYACEYAQQPDYNPHNPYNQSMYKQRYDSKFAELIVRECIDCARGAGLADDVAVRNGLGFNDGISEAVTHMKKHFGVEE